jgi:hypothetical protein
MVNGSRSLRLAVKQDKVVFIFNFFDELRRIAAYLTPLARPY